jgi:phage-related holin
MKVAVEAVLWLFGFVVILGVTLVLIVINIASGIMKGGR